MRTRLLVVLGIVIILVGVVAALVLTQSPTAQTPPADATQVSNDAAQVQPTVIVETPLPTPTPLAVVDVVIAVQDIPRGVPISADAIAVIPFPEEFAPFGAFGNPEDAIGKLARTDIYREQILLTDLLVDNLQEVGKYGSDAAAIIPSNRIAVSVPMDRLTSVAYGIRPGDRVDVIASFLFIDVNQQYQSAEPNTYTVLNIGVTPNPAPQAPTVLISPGASVQGDFDTRLVPNVGSYPFIVSPSEQPRPRLATQRTVQDALVIWIGNFPEDGRIFRPAPSPTPPPTPTPEGATPDPNAVRPTAVPPSAVIPDIITLAVSPQDAVVLSWLVEAGIPLTFGLRSASATSLGTTDSVTLDYIMNRFTINVPEKFTYSIEPAIRSIRSIEIASEITLVDEEPAVILPETANP